MPTLKEHFKSSWIQVLPEEIRSEFRSKMSSIDLKNGQVLYSKGDFLAGIYEIRSGSIKLSAFGFNGNEMVLNICHPPTIIGDLYVITNSKSLFTATSMAKSELGILPRESFDQLRAKYPAVNELLLKAASYRQFWLYQFLQDLSVLDIEARLAGRLRDLAFSMGEKISDGAFKLALKQDDLANMLGVTRQTVNQLLKRWEEAEIIELVYRGVKIRDIGRLIALADSNRESSKPQGL
ncbi:HTH-type transcriptional regulator Cmr [Zhongshania aliphaticivorans]|uniref:HTH-type transcriptional regulator Cmr n=1 Tax=Zhongshania aliphaticivorans TaxID=1470434 RepID=A0A5S9NRG9_9GAMM|nr:Crp/Fnr family transcriptional regulator [Zhongshania aliphaticivorans]CAA0093146.1 HTH-type transcriptional regulator Cmr [Zhongshania aliphaticivorans]CAA0110925.1 HTH-type transcriptional regulator Cmr [Zhongshania aliphaticivorans]